MRFSNIILSIDDNVARLTLNRPRTLNSLDGDTMAELAQAIHQVGHDAQAKVLVLTGAGRAFCAGQDLNDPAMHEANGQPPDIGDLVEQRFKPLVGRLQNLGIPTLAAVNGLAAGAGASLALSCDVVVAARSAYFLQAFSKLGLTPDTGATWYLTHFIGASRARALAMLAEKLPAEQAEQWGLIWKSTEDDAFETEIDLLARRLAAMPTQAMVGTRQLIQAAGSNTLEKQLSMEAAIIREMGRTQDYNEGLKAFMQKRPPRFTGQ